MHVFITGGTRGIGLGLVKEFLKEGHKVSYTGTSNQSIEKHINELQGLYNPYVCDVRNKENIKEVVKDAIEEYGNIDVFINNAGVDQDRLYVHELSEEEIKRVIDINITGTILGTSVALDIMKEQGYGRVYNFEGLGSNNMVIPQTIIYGTSKRAITYFSKAANKEMKDYQNIFVGTIQPGMVFTELLLKNLGDDGMKVARILGNEVGEVTKYIVKEVIKGKRTIKFPSYKKAPRNLIKKREIRG